MNFCDVTDSNYSYLQEGDGGFEEGFTRVSQLLPSCQGRVVWLRGRIHKCRHAGRLCFIVLRQQYHTVQLVLIATPPQITRAQLVWASRLPPESVVDVCGTVQLTEMAVTDVTQNAVEIAVTQILCISRAASQGVPFFIDSLMISPQRQAAKMSQVAELDEEIQRVSLLLEMVRDADRSMLRRHLESLQYQKFEIQDAAGVPFTNIRLDNRCLDLHSPANIATFKIQSQICLAARAFLESNKFIEIHTPKLQCPLPVDFNRLRVSYFGQEAELARSSRWHHYLAMASDFQRMYELGPVFDSSAGGTHRHLTQWTTLQMAMQIYQHHTEALDLVEELLSAILVSIASSPEYKAALQVIANPNQQLLMPLDPPEKFKFVRITFKEAIGLLKKFGEPVDDNDMDFSLTQVRALSAIVGQHFGCQLFVLHRPRIEVTPFYCMPSAEDPRCGNAFAVYFRGERVLSGSQFIHDKHLLEERASRALIFRANGTKEQELLNTARYGVPPFVECALGLERLTMALLSLQNIRLASLFPRDSRRLVP